MLIVDETMPLVECDFMFGSTPVHCSSRFPFTDVPTVIQMATNIMLASKDDLSHIRVDDRLVQGILLPAAETVPEYPVDVCYVYPGMHHSIVSVLEEDPIAFVVGNGQWEIGIHFQFGSQHVTFDSQFPSQLIPDALIKARDICGSLGFWDPDSKGTLIEPLEDPYYFNQVFSESLYPNFYL
jgi:hypothetical protein